MPLKFTATIEDGEKNPVSIVTYGKLKDKQRLIFRRKYCVIRLVSHPDDFALNGTLKNTIKSLCKTEEFASLAFCLHESSHPSEMLICPFYGPENLSCIKTLDETVGEALKPFLNNRLITAEYCQDIVAGIHSTLTRHDSLYNRSGSTSESEKKSESKEKDEDTALTPPLSYDSSEAPTVSSTPRILPKKSVRDAFFECFGFYLEDAPASHTLSPQVRGP